MSDDDQLPSAHDDPSKRFIVRCIESPGWSVQCVDESDQEPVFAYTVGLTQSFRHAELLVFGYPSALAVAVLNVLAERIRDGERFAGGGVDRELLEDHQVRFRQVQSPDSFAQYAAYALWYYAGRPFELLQLVWPDADHHFPDDAEAPDWLRGSQPLVP